MGASVPKSERSVLTESDTTARNAIGKKKPSVIAKGVKALKDAMTGKKSSKPKKGR